MKRHAKATPSHRRRARLATPFAVAVLALAFAAPSAFAASAPKVSVGVTVPSDSALTFATLGGTVNPEGQATTYHFEYGETTSYGDSAPAVDASAGSGTANVTVTRTISELELDTTYHYRLVATNATGTTYGPDLTFDTGPDLANGMHYELVSPVDTNGGRTIPRLLSPDGNRVAMTPGAQGFGDAESQHGVMDTYLGTRTPSGWVTNAMNPPQGPETDSFLGRTIDMTPDLATELVLTASQEQYVEGKSVYRLVRPGDLDYGIFPEVHDLTGSSTESPNVIFAYIGASEDFSHLYVATTANTSLLPTDPPPGTLTAFSEYELIANPPTIRRVDLDNAGNPLSPVCFVASGGGLSPNGSIGGRTENSISADGSKVFFGARATTTGTSGECASVPARLYARINGTSTVEISASECQPACSTPRSDAGYDGASKDGSRVVFATSQQLVNGDTDLTRDLYLYDFDKPAGHHLSLVSGGDATDPTPGSGAQVKNMVTMSDDGSRIYFVAGGVLTTGENTYGQTAQAGANNLYLYEPDTNTTTFIAQLESSDSLLWGDTSTYGDQLSDASGDFLLMSLYTRLSPNDTDSALDLYRYDAKSGELLKVTPGNTADSVNYVSGGWGTSPMARAISADGSTIVFETAAALQKEDTNGVNDTYMWHEGSVSLVTGGKAIRGSNGALVSEDGDTVAFSTAASLVPRDANSAVSTYVARTGADVEPPIVPPTPPCASSDLCRGSTPAAPTEPALGTPGFSGPGNEATPKPKTNQKKKAQQRKKKKQQQKKAQQKKKQQQQKKKHHARKQTTRRAG